MGEKKYITPPPPYRERGMNQQALEHRIPIQKSARLRIILDLSSLLLFRCCSL